MAAYVVCECCGSKIPAAQEDVGKAVVCPVSRRLVMVYPGDLHVIPDPPKRKRRKWPAALLALLLLLAFLGAGGYVAWGWLGQEKKDDTAQNNPEPEKPRPQPAPDKKTPPDVDITAAVPAFPSVKKTDPGPVAVKPEEPEKKEPDPPPAKVEPPLIKTAAEKDVNGLPVYELANRLDLRKPDELERELLNVREIQLDTPAAPDTSKKLFDDGSKLRAEKKAYPGPVLAAKGRDDLAGLPFKVGNAADLGPTKAGDVEKHSAQLRKAVQDSSPGGTVEPNKLYAALLDGKAAPGNDPAWATDAAVPGIQKLLQHESKYVRRLAVEALRKNPSPAATELLCRWAVFDVDPENRAAAVNALGERKNDRAAIKNHLLELIRYPWPRAAEHAAEALVALRMVEAVPNLVVLLDLPDPDAPEKAADGTSYRREMVRTNTARNCLLCHTPSPGAEPLRGVDYKNQAASATSTYLRHDFSAGLPATAAGKAGPQRYDFVAGVFPVATPGPSPDPSPYREAVLWALRHLTGEDVNFTGWAKYRGTAVAPDYRLTYWTGRYRTWYTNPTAGSMYWTGDWGDKFLWLELDEQAAVLAHLASVYGPQPTYDALIAYLESYRLTGTPEEQKKAVELLAYYRKVGVAGFVDEARVRRVYANPKTRAVYRGYAQGYVWGRGGVYDRVQHAPLYAGLSDRDRAVRLQNIRYFGNYQGIDEDVYVQLARLTGDEDPEVRLAAAETLQRLHKAVPENTPARVVQPLSQGLVKLGKWPDPKQKAEFDKTMDYLLADVRQPKAPGYPAVLAAAVGETPTDLPAKTLARHLRDMDPTKGPSSRAVTKEEAAKLARLLTRPEFEPEAKSQLLAAKDNGVYALIGVLKDTTNPVPLRVAAADLLGRAATGKNGASNQAWNAARDALADAHNDPSKEVARAADAARNEVIKDAP